MKKAITTNCQEIPPMSQKQIAWFKSKIAPATEANGCHLWTGALNGRGYGCVRFGKKRLPRIASRVAYKLTHGHVPLDMFVCHSCDNPKCVNPDHLFLGDYEDNKADAMAHNRVLRGNNHPARTKPAYLCRGKDHWMKKHPERIRRGKDSAPTMFPEKMARGEEAGASKLTECEVREIRAMHSSGLGYKTIARQFKINPSNVSHIVKRRTWRHVT